MSDDVPASPESAAPTLTEATVSSTTAPKEGPPAAATNPADTSLARLEARIEAGIAEVLAEFRGKLAYDATKQEQVDRLHAELQGHRADLVGKAVKPLLLGLVRLHDDVGKVLGALREKPEADLTPALLLRHIAEIQDDVALLLGQHGAETFTVMGDAFDPRRQTAARMVPTDDAARVGGVAARVRPGFEIGDAVLQKERVAVYTAAPPAACASAGGEA